MEVAATRSDWLLKVLALKPKSRVAIYPRDGLTFRMCADAMTAQGLTGSKYKILVHGSTIYVYCIK